jgi:hypothetical protein
LLGVSAIEPLGVEVNQSNSLYALLPTNKPNCWVCLLLNHLGLMSKKSRHLHTLFPNLLVESLCK